MFYFPKIKKLCLLFGISLLGFISFLDATIVSAALPSIQSSFNLSMTELQWVMNAFFLGISALIASMGRLADLYGRRCIFYSGTLIFTLASIGAGCATVPWVLIFCRAFQGVATASIIPVGIALIQAVHRKEEMPRAMSIFGSIAGAGLALGPIIGGVLVSWFGWRAVFFINIPFIVFSFILCVISVKESYADSKKAVDYGGIVFLTLAISALVFALFEANLAGWGSITVWMSFVVAIVSLCLFIFIERVVKNPMMTGYLFRNRVFLACIILVFLGGGAMSTGLFIDPLYLHIVLNQSNTAIGTILFIVPFIVVISAYVVGHVHSYIEARFFMMGAALAYFGVAILHMLFGVDLNYTLIFSTFILMGLAWGIVNTAPGIAVGEAVEVGQVGVAIGVLLSFFNIGAVVLLSVALVIFHAAAIQNLKRQFALYTIHPQIADGIYLQRFISQPHHLRFIVSQLTVDSSMATTILRQTFVSAMHKMYWPITILSVMAWLGLVLIMRKKSS